MSDTAVAAKVARDKTSRRESAAERRPRERTWPSARQCKWIDGDPKREGHWHWCLAPVDQAGGQYCTQHTRRVYMPERSR